MVFNTTFNNISVI